MKQFNITAQVVDMCGTSPGQSLLYSQMILSKDEDQAKNKVISIPVGRDTFSQTQAYIKEMKSRKLYNVIIATDAFHCQRTITMAKDLGATATCSPASTGPNTLAKSRYRYLIREAGAYLAYITLGRRGIHISDHLTNSKLVRYVYDPVA